MSFTKPSENKYPLLHPQKCVLCLHLTLQDIYLKSRVREEGQVFLKNVQDEWQWRLFRNFIHVGEVPAALIVNIWKINCTCQKTLSRQMLQFLFKMQDQNMYHQLLYFETLQTLPKIKFMTQSHKLKLKNRLWGFIYVDKNRLFIHHSHLRRKKRKMIWKR